MLYKVPIYPKSAKLKSNLTHTHTMPSPHYTACLSNHSLERAIALNRL